MKRWRVCAVVAGSKYLGEVEAETREDAIKKGYELDTACVSLCHACAGEVEDAEIQEILVEEVPQ